MKKKIFVTLYIFFSLASVWAISQDARLFGEAERRYQKGDYQFALSRYEKLIQEHPSSEFIADAHYRKALIYFRTGKPEEAAEYLLRVKNRYGYTRFAAYIPFWQGAVDYSLERYETALEHFNGFLSKNTERYRRDALFYRALCLRELGNTEEALETVGRIANTAKELFSEPRIFRLFADLLIAHGEYEELLSAYEAVDIEEAPKGLVPSLDLYQAEAFHGVGDTEKAEKIYQELLDSSTDVSRIAYQRLFNLYLQEGREEDQARVLEGAQAALSGYPRLLNEFYMRVGIESYKRGSYELAESYLRRVARSVPAKERNPLVPLYLAYAAEKNEGAGEALSLLQKYFSEFGEGYKPDEGLLFTAVRLSAQAQEWKAVESYGKEYRELYGDGSRGAKVSYLYAFALKERKESRAALAVLQNLSVQRKEGSYYEDILMLTARVYMDLQRWTEAEEALREYLPLHPESPDVYVELMRVSFSQKKWEEVLHWIDSLEKAVPDLEKLFHDTYTKVRYIGGLALLGLQRYEEGVKRLEGLIKDEVLEEPYFEGIGPHLVYFTVWGRYKRADYSEAIERFEELEKRFSDHPRVQEGRYFAAWAAFADGRFREAEKLFAEYARYAETAEERMKGRYMYAKSLASRGEDQEALSVYRQVFEEGGGSGLADDALFESAALVAGNGRINEAVDLYIRLFRSYPRSPLAEEALYRRGELLMAAERYEEAREAFYEHRSRFPKGELVDVSLYWGAMAARREGEPYGAALLLERLVDEYSQSNLHADALRDLAELYEELGDYEKAVGYYTRFRSLYPQQAKEYSVGRKIGTLKEIMEGKSPREAELSVELEEQGLDTPVGRRAAVELASIYLNRFTGDKRERQKEAISLLRSVVEKADEDSRTAARAQYYIGEYHRRRGEYTEAAKTYAEAAVLSRGYEDLTARSMYMAAETAHKAGDKNGARRMLRKLESEFPDSEWIAEGRRLIDENE